MIAAGLVVMAAGNYWMARMNLQISPWQVIWPRMVLTAGPRADLRPGQRGRLQVHPVHLRGAAVGLLSLLRTEGGSVGTSMAQTIQERREQFHCPAWARILGPLNPHVQSFLEQTREFFMQWTGDPARSQQMAVQALDNLRQQQAASLAFFDIFWVCRRPVGGARLSWSADEALGGREGRAHRGGVDPTESASWLFGCVKFCSLPG